MSQEIVGCTKKKQYGDNPVDHEVNTQTPLWKWNTVEIVQRSKHTDSTKTDINLSRPFIINRNKKRISLKETEKYVETHSI